MRAPPFRMSPKVEQETNAIEEEEEKWKEASSARLTLENSILAEETIEKKCFHFMKLYLKSSYSTACKTSTCGHKTDVFKENFFNNNIHFYD